MLLGKLFGKLLENYQYLLWERAMYVLKCRNPAWHGEGVTKYMPWTAPYSKYIHVVQEFRQLCVTASKTLPYTLYLY